MPPVQWLITCKTAMEEGSFAGVARRLTLTFCAISHPMRDRHIAWSSGGRIAAIRS